MHPLHHRDKRAGGGFRTHMNRITGAAPFCVEPHRHMCLAGIEPGTPRVTVSYASRYTTDTAEGVGVEPTRPCGSLAFQARPVTRSGSPSVLIGWDA